MNRLFGAGWVALGAIAQPVGALAGMTAAGVMHEATAAGTLLEVVPLSIFALVAMNALVTLPHVEELLRCRAAERRGEKGIAIARSLTEVMLSAA